MNNYCVHKIIFILAFFVVPFFMITAQNNNNDFQIKIQNWEEKDQKKPAVKWFDDNIVIDAVDKNEKDQKKSLPLGKYFSIKSTPVSCLAARIDNPEEYISWSPKWYFTGAGCIKIATIALSPDKSTLAIVELVGSETGPFGSRILFLNTYNWKFARVINLKKHKIAKICFVPDSINLICWAEKQLQLKMPNELLVVNCKNGDISNSTTLIKEAVNSMICDHTGTKLYVTYEGFNGYCVFKPNDFEQAPQKIKTKDINGKIAISQDNSHLVVAGGNFLEFFEIDYNKAVNCIKLPKNKGCSAVTFTSRNNNVAWVETGKKALFYKNNLKLDITNNPGPLLIYLPEEKILGVSKMVKSAITLYSVPSLEEKDTIFPMKIKPRIQYNPEFCAYIPHMKSYIFADEEGNFYLISKPKKKWRKQIIISCEK